MGKHSPVVLEFILEWEGWARRTARRAAFAHDDMAEARAWDVVDALEHIVDALVGGN